MKKIRRTGLLLLLAALAAAAPSNAGEPYKKAKAEGKVGYTDEKATPARATVSFQGDQSMEPARIYEYALLRAAQVTLDAGFDWFFAAPPARPSSAPVGESVTPESPAPESPEPVSPESTAMETPAAVYGDFTPYYDAATRLVSLDVAMGRGERPPNNPAAFDARALKKALKHLK